MLRTAAIAAVAVCLGTGSAFAQDTPTAAGTFPGGATSVSEVHTDWTVACSIANAVKVCSISQIHLNAQTNQRVYGVELRAGADRLDGVVMLPFGLSVSTPIQMVVDEVAIAGTWPFSTCNEFGCFVPVTFDAAAIEAITAGAVLTITATDLAAKPLEFAVSLNGLTSATNRSKELVR